MFLAYVQESASADKKEVRFIWLADFTGPYAGPHASTTKGIEAFVKWANDTNYVEGIRFSLDKYDTRTDVGIAVNAFHTAMGKKPRPLFTTGGWATPIALAIKPLAEREEIPCIDAAPSRPVLIPPAWTLSLSPPQEGQFASAAGWIIKNWKPNSEVEFIKRHYKNRPPKLGLIAWDNSYGRSLDQKESRDYIKKVGVEYVGAEYIPMSPLDTTPQLSRLKEKGVDFLYVGAYAPTHQVIVKDTVKLGIRDDFMHIGMQIDELAELKGFVGDLANGIANLTIWPPDTEGLPSGLVELLSKQKMVSVPAYNTGVEWGDLAAYVIRRTIERVGMDKLDGKSCWYTLMHETKNVKLMGCVSPHTFGPNKLYAVDLMAMYYIKDGKVTLLAKDIYCPDLHPGGKDVVK
jgi:ABC-type branched-subunit amino acid transport system substrate-binding protein